MLKNDAEFFRMIYHFFVDGTKLTYAAMGVAVVVAILYFGLFFRGFSGFKDDAEKAGKIPILDSDYDYVESKWSKEKIMIWILLSVGSGILAYYQLPEWFPHIFTK
jgi:hypothetical protein